MQIGNELDRVRPGPTLQATTTTIQQPEYYNILCSVAIIMFQVVHAQCAPDDCICGTGSFIVKIIIKKLFNYLKALIKELYNRRRINSYRVEINFN